MKSDWKKEPLRALVSYISKGIAPVYAEKESDTTVRVINQKCNRNYRISYDDARLHDLSQKNCPRERFLREDDIIINSTGAGTAGRVAQMHKPDKPTIVDGHMIIIRSNNKVTQKYLGYAVRARQAYILQLDEGSTGQTELNRERLLDEIEVFYPVDLKEQAAIADFFAKLDEKIITNECINDNLQQQAQLLFREWFIDNPNAESWERGNFAALIDRTINGDWGKDSATGNFTEMVYCIRGADIPEVKAGNKGKMPTRFILPKNYQAKKLVDGDIVVEISGGSPTQSTGRAAAVSDALLDRYDKGMICTNFCKAITPRAGYSMFIYHYWQYLYDAGVFFGYENGTTGIKNLDISGIIEREEIVIPSYDLIERFDKVCQSLYRNIYNNGLENERLASLRDALLPQLLSGEIDVSELQI